MTSIQQTPPRQQRALQSDTNEAFTAALINAMHNNGLCRMNGCEMPANASGLCGDHELAQIGAARAARQSDGPQ